jgi:hypothetical protein
VLRVVGPRPERDVLEVRGKPADDVFPRMVGAAEARSGRSLVEDDEVPVEE